VVLALKAQLAGLGLSMVEFLSNCPTNWHMTPTDSLVWIKNEMAAYFPLGDYKVTDAVKALK